jgi:hypothetical protein
MHGLMRGAGINPCLYSTERIIQRKNGILVVSLTTEFYCFHEYLS